MCRRSHTSPCGTLVCKPRTSPRSRVWGNDRARIPHTRHVDGDQTEGRSLTADGSNCEELCPHGRDLQSFQPPPSVASLLIQAWCRCRVDQLNVGRAPRRPFSSVPGPCRAQGALLELQGRILPGGPGVRGVARLVAIVRSGARCSFLSERPLSVRRRGLAGNSGSRPPPVARPGVPGRPPGWRCWNEWVEADRGSARQDQHQGTQLDSSTNQACHPRSR
jgi:hypothetical protein